MPPNLANSFSLLQLQRRVSVATDAKRVSSNSDSNGGSGDADCEFLFDVLRAIDMSDYASRLLSPSLDLSSKADLVAVGVAPEHASIIVSFIANLCALSTDFSRSGVTSPKPQRSKVFEYVDTSNHNLHHRDINSPFELHELFSKPLTQRPASVTINEGIYGRIAHGSTPEHWEGLARSHQRFTWAMSSESLAELITLERPVDMLEILGITRETIQYCLDNDIEHRMHLFRSDQCIPADWDGVMSIVKKFYPEVSAKIIAHEAALRHTPFEAIEQALGYSMCEVQHKHGRSDERYITLERLEQRPGTLFEVRAFLYYELGLGELFTGTGRTQTEDGDDGVREFFIPNMPLAELADLCTIDMPVRAADLLPADFDDFVRPPMVRRRSSRTRLSEAEEYVSTVDDKRDVSFFPTGAARE